MNEDNFLEASHHQVFAVTQSLGQGSHCRLWHYSIMAKFPSNLCRIMPVEGSWIVSFLHSLREAVEGRKGPCALMSHFLIWGLPAGKESACNAEDLGSIPGLGRSPGEGKGYPLPYSGLENSIDCIVYGVTES